MQFLDETTRRVSRRFVEVGLFFSNFLSNLTKNFVLRLSLAVGVKSESEDPIIQHEIL